MSDTPAVAGLDYALRSVEVAVLQGVKILSSAHYDLGEDTQVRSRVLLYAMKDLVRLGVKELWLEEPWVRQGRGVGTALKLHEVPAQVKALAALSGITAHAVAVPTWRAAVLGDGRMRTGIAKPAAINYVRYAFAYETTNHNVADSICLASYGASVRKLQEMAR